MSQSESETKPLRLKVAGLRQSEVGKGIVRLGNSHAQELGLSRGDVVEILGRKSTAAIAVPAAPEDQALDVIRMDGLVRGNAGGISEGDFVEVRKAEWQPAVKVVMAPAKEGLRIAGSGDALRPTLLGRPLSQGDVISTSVFQQNAAGGLGDGPGDDMFRRFFNSPAFGLMEIRLIVAATQPRGIVRVTEATEIELSPEYKQVAERIVPQVTYDDLGGLGDVLQRVREMIELPLRHPELFDRLGIDPPKGVLLHGAPGTGKTLLAKAVASESDAFFLSINGPEIMGKHYGESEERLRGLFEEAEKNAPAILFIDEIDSIAPKRGDVAGEVERRIVAQLLGLMDGLKGRGKVVVIGATNRVDALDEALRRPGRFDREILLPIPNQKGRLEILQIHTRGMPLADGVSLEQIVASTHGFTGSDLAALAREAALAALRRVIPSFDLEQTIPKEVLEQLTVQRGDFDQAFKEVQPSALREIAVEVPNVRFDQIGGLEEAKQKVHEMVELPLRRPEAFTRLGVRAPKGVLLYGPPGTGKTMLAKAVATEAGANFITAKGSQLLSKWYGESEKKIAEFFRRARQVTPAILFFDELDSLVPVRSASIGEPQVTERVVNQMLSELDGMELLNGVAILGATNRPDMLDPALLRPGRFDEMVYVPIPDRAARIEILRSHTAPMTLEPDFDIEAMADRTEGFTGADIAGVCTKAGLLALREDIDAKCVKTSHFEQAVAATVRSVSDEMVKAYAKIERKAKQRVGRIGFVS